MKCYVCDKDNWESMGDFHKERELRICKECGSVAYKIQDGEEARMLQYYKNEYRPEPAVGNLITSIHKLNYVKVFLAELLKDKKGLRTCDVGCAIGYLPDWLRKSGHKAYGCEYTLTYRRFAEAFYKIPVLEEIDERHKYDLISLYHTFEHMVEPDKKLAKYVSLLNEGGHIFIATPEWFRVLEEPSGLPITTAEHYFHKDHINVYSEKSLKNLFKKAGLTIVKEDHVQYGQTYLLRKGTPEEVGQMEVEKWEDKKEYLLRAKKAIEHYAKKEYQKAIDIIPQFPEAWMKLIFEVNMKVPDIQRNLFERAFEACGDYNVRLNTGKGMWHHQRQEYKDALQHLDYVMKVKPSEDMLMYIGFALEALGKPYDAMNCWMMASSINPQKWEESIRLTCAIASKMPTWDERARAKFAADAAQNFKPEFPMEAV